MQECCIFLNAFPPPDRLTPPGPNKLYGGRGWLPLRGAPPLGGEGWLGCNPWHEGHPSVTCGDSSPQGEPHSTPTEFILAPEGSIGEGRKSVKKRAALLHVLAFSFLDLLFGVLRGEQPLSRAAVRLRSNQSPSGALKHTSGPALRDGGARCAPPSARYRK